MRLYTIQSLDAVKTLLLTGELRGEKQYIEPLFHHAYDWLLRVAPQYGVPLAPYPVWTSISKDMLLHIFQIQPFTDRQSVMITLEVPDNLCLYSTYNGWESVLCNTYVHYSYEEACELDATIDWDDETLDLDNLPYPFTLEESWHRIFEIDRFPDDDIQVVIPSIQAHMVKNIEVLTWNPHYDASQYNK